MTDSGRTRHGPAAAIAVVGLALVLRVEGMFGWWVNPDEGIYLAVITQESFPLFWSEALATAHPPLYFLVLRAMASLGTDLTWLRSLALVSGCAAVWAFILLGRDLGGSGARGWIAGLTSGLLLAVSPVAIELSRVIRPYMTLVLLLALMLHLLWRYRESRSGRVLLPYVVCASLAVFLHYSAALALGVIVAVVAVDGIRRGVHDASWRRLMAVQAIPGALVCALYLLQMRELLASDAAELSVETWLSGYLIDTPLDAWLGLIGLHAALVGRAASASAALVTLIGLAWAARSGERELCVVVAGALLVATACAALRLYPLGAGRHAAWLLPFVTPGLAWAVAWAVGSRGRASVIGAVVAAGLLLRAPLGANAAEPPLAEQVLREEHVAAMADVLGPRSEPRTVVMSIETYRLLLPLYYREHQQGRTSADGTFLHFRWGERDVIVLPGLDLVVRAEHRGRPNHLYTGTLAAAAELGIPLPENEPVLVVSGSWRQGVFALADLARRAGLGGETWLVPGLIAIELDLKAYGRALAGGPTAP